jgi:hypothetical protein
MIRVPALGLSAKGAFDAEVERRANEDSARGGLSEVQVLG